jgi:hypothetical protein
LFEERAQGGLLVGVEDPEHPLFCAGECMFELRDSAGSGGREADGVAAPVLWRPSALDEICSFEVVKQADHVGAVDPQRFG